MSKEIAPAIETAMRNFAIEIAYGDAGERAASAEKLRSAIRAELAAERERRAAECRKMAEALREASPLDGSRAAVAQELERRILGA